MRTVCQIAGLLSLLVVAPWAAAAEGQIPWVTDFAQACEMAGEQRRLLLLHFYGDHCPPCERVEQHVFSQPQVVQAITKNYIPVKVHVEKQAELAAKYGVRRWPTDVFCSPSGLEITRAVSPQTAVEYISLVDHIALQGGVGAARQWAAGMENVAASQVQQGTAEAQAFANRVGASAQGYVNQAETATQNYTAQANGAVQGFAGQFQQQYAQATQQFQAANQNAQAVAGQAQQQVQQQYAQANQQFQGTAQQFQGAAQQYQTAGQGALNNLRSSWQPQGAPADLAAAPAPAPAAVAGPVAAEQPFAAPPVIAPAPLPQFSTVPPGGYAVNPSPPAYQPQAGYPPPQFAHAPPQFAQAPPQQPAAASAFVPPAAPAPQQPFGPAPAVPASAVAAVAPAPAPPAAIPASQAPPSALDGFCPVSLLESMAWKKADPRFGVVHRNRTYLFASAAEQQRFLAAPDRYAPVLDGCDPVRFAKTGELVPGKRSCGITYNKQIFLFADEQSLAEFSRTPDSAKSYATTVYQAMLPQGGTPYR